MEASPQKKQMSIKDAATLLLLMHGSFFSDKELLTATKLCQITFKSDEEHARALWEWFYFGLHVIVEGIQDNNRGSEDVGMAIARQLLSECFFHLNQSGLETTELAARESEIHQRLDRYNAVVRTGKLERVGLTAAASVLGVDVSPGNIPKTIEAYEFGICVNQSHSACLKLVNEFFGEHGIVV
jgi:hypothetical protein